MTVSVEVISSRKDQLENEIVTVKQRLVEYDRKKTEDVALVNALQGALQQCDFFLKEFSNEKPEMAGDVGNDNRE